jgi:hypothetical protein
MKKIISIGQFEARYDDQENTWFVFKAKFSIGRIIQETCEIVFTDSTTPYEPGDLAQLQKMVNEINNQYIELNP